MRICTAYLIERTTSQRPFVCEECGKSYLRETHLQAHSRSHLPESKKPYICNESPDCTKRFWTLQHLHVHENTHRGEKSYAVSTQIREIGSPSESPCSARRRAVMKPFRNTTSCVLMSAVRILCQEQSPTFAPIRHVTNPFLQIKSYGGI